MNPAAAFGTAGASQATTQQTTTTTISRSANARDRRRSSSSSSSSSSSDDDRRRHLDPRNAQQLDYDALRQRGLYRGPGAATAERTQVIEAEQYVKQDAPVVEEHIHKRAVHEVVPTVRREREVAEIRHAVLPIRQQVRQDRTYSERQLEEIRERDYREGIREDERRKNRAISERLSRGYREELPTEHEYVYAKPQVEEVVRPRIIHEIHPVVQRQVEKEHYERRYLPIRERIVEGPRVAGEVEVLKPLSFEEWTRTHGRAIYEQSGHAHGGIGSRLLHPSSDSRGSRYEFGYSSRRESRQSRHGTIGGGGIPLSSDRRASHIYTDTYPGAPISSYDAHYGPGGHSIAVGGARGIGPRIERSSTRRRYGSGRHRDRSSSSSISSPSSSSESDREYDDRHRYRSYRQQQIAPSAARGLPPTSSRRPGRRHFF